VKHLHRISALPPRAQTTGVCGTVSSDFQAQLCFLLTILTQFFLPLAQIKNPSGGGDTA